VTNAPAGGNRLEERCEAFLAYLTEVRRLSAHTIQAYGRDLSDFAAFCAAQDLSCATAVREAHVRRWVSEGHRRGLAASSQQRRLSALRAFFTWVSRESRDRHNPALAVQAPRRPRKLPRALEADQVGRLLEDPGEAMSLTNLQVEVVISP